MNAKQMKKKMESGHINFLIIEDNISIQLKLEADLRGLGFKGSIYFRDNAEECVKSLEILDIDFVFLDWNLKGNKTGYDALIEIRNAAQFKDLPVVLFSVKNDVNFLLDAIKAGASDYLVKPWERTELIRKIELTIG